MDEKNLNPQAIIKVMHVDDSAIVRRMVSIFFDDDPYINVVATAENGHEALVKLKQVEPDVVILDIEMPVMDGITALPQILERYPHIKVIMCSTLTERGAQITMKALSLGAIDCIAKPTASTASENSFGDFREKVIQTVKGLFPEKRRLISPHTQAEQQKQIKENATAALLRGDKKRADEEAEKYTKITTGSAPASKKTFDNLPEPASESLENYREFNNPHAYSGKPDLIAIGSSTGGPQALFEVLQHLKNISVPILITQHMPPTFTKLLAQHIQEKTGIPSHEGAEGMIIKAGEIYVAPGGFHLIAKKKGNDVALSLYDGPQVNFCKPSVDVMFESLIQIYGKKMLGIILTGMGHDGLDGCRELVSKNGRVIAQNKETSVVWGMPRAVALANICTKVLPLTEIGPWIRKQL